MTANTREPKHERGHEREQCAQRISVECDIVRTRTMPNACKGKGKDKQEAADDDNNSQSRASQQNPGL